MAFIDGLGHTVSEQLILPRRVWPRSTFYHSRSSLSNSQVQVLRKHFGGTWTSWLKRAVTWEGRKRWPGKTEKYKTLTSAQKANQTRQPCPSAESVYPSPTHGKPAELGSQPSGESSALPSEGCVRMQFQVPRFGFQKYRQKLPSGGQGGHPSKSGNGGLTNTASWQECSTEKSAPDEIDTRTCL